MNLVALIKSVLLSSGAAWVLWILAALSVVSLAIVVERLLFYRRLGGDLRPVAERLDGLLSAGEFDTAIAELDASPAIAAAIAVAGLRLADRGAAAADKTMQSAVALQRSRLEKWLAYLGTVGNNAPFVGLFGTVVGVVGAFDQLGRRHAGAIARQAAQQAVMASIADALVATAAGIAVALPAVAMYNYFQRRIANLLSSADALSNLVLAYLVARSDPTRGSEPRPEPGPGEPGGADRGSRSQPSQAPSDQAEREPRRGQGAA